MKTYLRVSQSIFGNTLNELLIKEKQTIKFGRVNKIEIFTCVIPPKPYWGSGVFLLNSDNSLTLLSSNYDSSD